MARNYVLTAALGEPVGNYMWGLVVVSPFQTALLVYDTLLTLPLEVQYIWRKKTQTWINLIRLCALPYCVHPLLSIPTIPNYKGV